MQKKKKNFFVIGGAFVFIAGLTWWLGLVSLGDLLLAPLMLVTVKVLGQ